MGATVQKHFSEASVDDLLQVTLSTLLDVGEPVDPTKGPTRELRGVTLELTNPRARLSRSESRGKVFGALGELLWYLSGSNSTEQIAYYLSEYRKFDEEGAIHGGYGPRLRGDGDDDQLAQIVGLLGRRRSSRRAVVQLFVGSDLLIEHVDIPCTCSLQFMIRDERLEMVVFMRSNDAYIGLPHDIFCFTMIQELVARSLDADVGPYTHMVGSLHLYDSNESHARAFLAEGWHSAKAMPAMPDGDNMSHLDELLVIEAALREGAEPTSVTLPSSPYWADLGRLLVVFPLLRSRRFADVETVRGEFSSPVFDLHIADRVEGQDPR